MGFAVDILGKRHLQICCSILVWRDRIVIVCDWYYLTLIHLTLHKSHFVIDYLWFTVTFTWMKEWKKEKKKSKLCEQIRHRTKLSTVVCMHGGQKKRKNPSLVLLLLPLIIIVLTHCAYLSFCSSSSENIFFSSSSSSSSLSFFFFFFLVFIGVIILFIIYTSFILHPTSPDFLL